MLLCKVRLVSPDCFDYKNKLFLVGKYNTKCKGKTWEKPTVIPRSEERKEIEGKFRKHALSRIISKDTKHDEFNENLYILFT